MNRTPVAVQSPRLLRPLTPGAAALVAALLALLLLPAPASAHAGLVGSDPTDGSTVSALDGEVVLTFSEEVAGPATVIVTDPEGTGLESGDPVVDGTEVRQAVDPATVSGQHTIAYRVVSSDGHPVTGQVRVTVELPADTTAEETPGATPDDEASEDAGDVPAVPVESLAETAEDDADDAAYAPWITAGVLALLLVVVSVVTTRRKRTQ